MKPNERIAILSGAFFLFGLAALIQLHLLWPGIMLLILLTALPILLIEEGWRMMLWLGAQMGIWLGGVPLLIRLHIVWPGILVLAGLSVLVVALVNPDNLEKVHKAELARRRRPSRPSTPYKAKAKRGIPVPPSLDKDDMLNIQPFNMPDEDDHDEADAYFDDDDLYTDLSRTGHR